MTPIDTFKTVRSSPLAVLLAGGIVLALPQAAQAQRVSLTDLQNQINGLQAQIDALQPGPQGEDGPPGVVGVFPWAGSVGAVPVSLGFQFVGPTASVTATAGQRLTGSATAALGKQSGNPEVVRMGLCYSTGSGSLVLFAGGPNYIVVEIDTLTRPYSISGSVVPGAGTHDVGFCLGEVDAALDNNDYVNGWVMVTE